MPQKPAKVDATESFGSDSFLDIIANMVGIMIILVMIVGLRVRNVTVEKPLPSVDPDVVVGPVAAEARRLERDLNKMVDEMKKLTALAEAKYDERGDLALLAAAQQAELDKQKASLADKEREAFDVQQAALLEQQRLSELERQLQFLTETATPETIKVKTYPTPLSRTVYGREAHFQLLEGRIVYVPLNELVDEVKRQVQQRMYRLRDMDEITETVGPIGGFRLRYSLERVNVGPSIQGGSISNGGAIIRTTQMTVVPQNQNLGETVAEALAERSEFRRTVADLDKNRFTITFWTYPDSFEAYRALREFLYQQGFTVAGRPLPMGQPISGSPQGSKTATQ